MTFGLEIHADYAAANEVKASFDDVYRAPTPHAYCRAMRSLEYEIADQAQPFVVEAVDWCHEANLGAWPTQLLDLGCSYGIGATVVKYRCRFAECGAFFAGRAPREFAACAAATRRWLEAVPPPRELRVVGMDTAEPAVRFALTAGLLAGGITRDLEEEEPADAELAWIRGSNLLMSTGAVGYVTERTVAPIARELGQEHPGALGPLAVVTILRMFDAEPVADAFAAADLRFGPVPGVHLRQRRFRDLDEQAGVLRLLAQRGIAPAGMETTGRLYADLFVAARPERFDEAVARMQRVAARR